MKYTNSKNEDILSEEQLSEILDRDNEFEAGKTETYTLDEIKFHFNVKESL